jgi:hypothetical protein
MYQAAKSRYFRHIKADSLTQSTAPSIGKFEKTLDLVKLWLNGRENYGLGGFLIATALSLTGDQPLLLQVLQAIGFVRQKTESSSSVLNFIAVVCLCAGLLLIFWGLLKPFIRPVRMLILQYSYQPISSVGARSVLQSLGACWIAPIHLDHLSDELSTASGRSRASNRLERSAKKIKGTRKIFYCGIAHIPLVGRLGFLLRNFQVEFFEINHNSKKSVLLTNNAVVRGHVFQRSNNGSPGSDVALIVEVSFKINSQTVQQSLQANVPEIRLSLPSPGLSQIESETDLIALSQQFRTLMNELVNGSAVKKIHLFYAGPTSLIFRFAQVLSENTDPEVLAYNYSRDSGRYSWGMSLNKGAKVVQLS